MKSLLTLLLLSIAWGNRPPQLEAVGDGGTLSLKLRNSQVYELNLRAGAALALNLERRVGGYQEASFALQCLGEPSPSLSLKLEGQPQILATEPLAFPKGPPALWISSAHQGRAALEALLPDGLKLKHLSLEEVPAEFGALRFAPLILLQLGDYLQLSEEAQRALKGAMASGVTLLIATGEDEGSAEALSSMAPVHLGPSARVGPQLGQALERISKRRSLKAPQEFVRLEADGAPVLLELPYGIGRLRVLSLNLSVLSPGVVAKAALKSSDNLGPVLRWLAAAPPPKERSQRLFRGEIWLSLLLLLPLILLSRRWPRLALLLLLPLFVTTLLLSPSEESCHTELLRALLIPLPEGQLWVASVDLELRRGGGQTLISGPGYSLDDVRPGGACLLSDKEGAAWLFEGEPGDHRRLSFFAFSSEPMEAPKGEVLERLPNWPPAPLAGASLGAQRFSIPWAPSIKAEGRVLLSRAPKENKRKHLD